MGSISAEIRDYFRGFERSELRRNYEVTRSKTVIDVEEENTVRSSGDPVGQQSSFVADALPA
uniref:Uncharacterized protein n=1 Tax=Peronospora matthiolae TaxID=2874970 RepID=A0AAV1USZ8_9STRA